MAESAKLLFYNKVIDGTAIKQIISRLVAHFGITYTAHILDQPKTLGFQQATYAAISLGIDDLSTAPSKRWLIQDAERHGYTLEKHHRYGDVHAAEKLRQPIETWYATSEYLKQEMNPNFRMTDPLNPVHMMSFSGARGSTSQVHQLVGMRGLMSDPQGQIIDLPIQSNFREGLSLTEYIISCYGARKGVVDTAVRTSDAGYLTRRLVEVVQHIVVRKIDCNTFQGISFNLAPTKKEKNSQIFTQPKLVGRVLADNIYINARCIAIRNQDISTDLIDRLVTLQTPLISIRSPLTCKSMLWICQLCYGWSLTHYGDLIELGEAVGIIAGQSIGEPGTQLTLRTFHTGGVFTGDIAEHVRASFNGTIKFDTDLVYPTRTRHGHPAWICRTDLSVSIKSKNEIHNLIIPSQSLLLIQNNQYVESKQLIAEVRAKISPFKEKVQKYIYSNVEGEMHWSKRVRHASKYLYSNVHLIFYAGHLWILSGSSCENRLSFVFFQNQDQINTKFFISQRKILLGKDTNQVNFQILDSSLEKELKTPTFSILYSGISNKNRNSIYSSIILYDYEIKRIYNEEKDEKFTLLERKDKEKNKRLFRRFVLNMPKSGILENNDIFAISNDLGYKIQSSGIIKYGTIKVNLVREKKEIFKNRKRKNFRLRPRYQVIQPGNFSLIPEEVHVSYQSFSSILVQNNSFIQKNTQITSDISSQVSGLVRIRRNTNSSYEIKVLPGHIYHPREKRNISKQNDILVPPGEKIYNKFQSTNWLYLQWITPSKEKPFLFIRPAIEFIVPEEPDSTKAFILNLPKKQEILKVKMIPYLLYEDGEKVQVTNKTSVQLVQTGLVLDWKKDSSVKKVYASHIEVRTNGLLKKFLQISLIEQEHSILDIEKKKNKVNLKYLFNNEVNYSSYSFHYENQLFSGYQGIIRISFNENREGKSFLILSPFDFLQISLSENLEKYTIIGENKKKIDSNTNSIFYTKSFDNEKKFKKFLITSGKFSSDTFTGEEFYNYNDINQQFHLRGTVKKFFLSIPKNFIKILLLEKLGLLGNLHNSSSSFPIFYWTNTYDQITFNKYSILHNFKDTFQVPKWYFLDENNKKHILDLSKNLIYHLLTWSFSSFLLCKEEAIQLVGLGQFICENICISSKYRPISESGQIIAIHKNCLIIRLAKPYLATGGATVHSHYGQIIKKGDVLITLVYERLKSGDIIQGLPKVEQLLEARPINSTSANLENGFEDWNKDMTKSLGSLWGFFLSAKITMKQSQINLVDQIQKVYQSQGVQISDKHIEIIVRQMTSKVLTLENGMANGSLPGELIEFSKAQRMNRLLEEAVLYKPILLGITKASLNTQSFISEASFQETTRVLAKAALRGRIDWLKGLKENVIFGGVISAGTGCQEVMWQVILEKQKENYSKRENNKLFSGRVRDAFSYYRRILIFPTLKVIRKTLKKSLLEINIDLNYQK
uniref:DNA-directed RNA polymerase subunit beta'' n=1 Tax=Leiosporoceros dussii TaxID=263836 RepID=A0A385KE38_9EMBR|nr:bet'' subunit of RNA polymerase [Leiosporoceros dussii]AXZ70937.1 bet'' subunit of RNA polymerase [Leiosporoceros dussii]